jgi:DNA-binding response OmpR family regulator
VSARALVCSEDERLAAALRGAGFEVVVAPRGVDALEQLRAASWELVGLDRAPDLATRAYLDGLPGGRRRDLFVLRFGEGYETGDRFAAWSDSADLVVDPADTPRLGELIAAAVREKNEFYAWFRRVQDAAGGRLGAHA